MVHKKTSNKGNVTNREGGGPNQHIEQKEYGHWKLSPAHREGRQEERGWTRGIGTSRERGEKKVPPAGGGAEQR